MKIFLISNMYPSEKYPHYGVFVKNIAEAMSASKEITITLSAIKGKSRNIFEKSFKYFIFFMTTFYKRLFGRYDFCYVHYPSHSYIPLFFLKLFKKQKIVVHIHGSDILKEENVSSIYSILKERISSLAIKNSDLIIVPSKYYRNVVIDKFHAPGEKIYVYASGGVNLKVFYPLSDKQDKKHFVIGYVGRIDKGKGIDTLVNAITLLKDDIKDLRSLIIGEGDMKEELIKLIQDSYLNKKVSLMGAMKQTDLCKHYNSMEVFIFPTERKAESLGLVGLEAMACGIPVIGSNIGGLQDYLIDGHNGFFFEPGNSKDLAEKILEFYSLSSKEKTILSKNALQTAKKYDSKTENVRLVGMFKSLVK